MITNSPFATSLSLLVVVSVTTLFVFFSVVTVPVAAAARPSSPKTTIAAIASPYPSSSAYASFFLFVRRRAPSSSRRYRTAAASDAAACLVGSRAPPTLLHLGRLPLASSIPWLLDVSASTCTYRGHGNHFRRSYLTSTSSSRTVAFSSSVNDNNEIIIMDELVMQMIGGEPDDDHQEVGGNDEQEDEFGDDAFLADFDVDAAVSGSNNNNKENAQASMGRDNVHYPHKRQKTTGAVKAEPSSSSSPFGSSSNFAVGSRVDAASEYNPPPASSYAGSSPTSTTQYTTTTSNDELDESLLQTLRTKFGHASYRPGQLDVLRSLVRPHDRTDVAVFWSTGSGKSLCYQIPPFHLNKIAVVVSPLISLMQDQCAKLNGSLGGGGFNNDDVAVFLGSGQTDPNAERRALDGRYKLIYVTPEKLLSGNGNFLDALAKIHHFGGGGVGGGNLCLIAVDESHCVSEWGHDFRPEYRQIGESLRSHPVLSEVPLLALTATAVPRVQEDIIKSLRMRPDATVVRRSFDRSNLDITVRRKPTAGGGYRAALQPLVKELSRGGGGGAAAAATAGDAFSAAATGRRGLGGQSTIVYVSTRNEVEEISSWLSQQLRPVGVAVEPYHAGLGQDARTKAHTNFLVGRTAVIVATVAFGMGIDKPDTRRVVHYGPPKTVEEYYQQIGRAGRDGLRAEVTMFANDSDFAKYKGDFYLGGLSSHAREATERSIDALRNFAMDTEVCRRAALLKFFEETPTFGERCGTCDTCVDRKLHGDDTERDFANAGARVILLATQAVPNQGVTVLEQVWSGKVVDDLRYRMASPSSVQKLVLSARTEMEKKRPSSYFKELLPALVNRNYIVQGTKTFQTPQGYKKSSVTYALTSKGRSVLDTQGPIMLPVPPSLREVERLEEEKRKKTLADLKDAGVDLDQIPKDELEEGDGEAIKALKCWFSYIDSLQRSGKTERVNELDDLRSRIEAWRSDMAERYRMAPASVMEEHLVVKIAYATASCRGQMERDALVAAGVRSQGIDDLVVALGEWAKDTHKNIAGDDSSIATSTPMLFGDDAPYLPASPWPHATYKPAKKTGLASWESSYNRFMAGEHPQTIAINPANGRPIQVPTVVGHVLDGLTLGRPVQLGRLSLASSAPTKEEWEELRRCEEESGMDVTADPNSSGKDGGKLSMKDFLSPIMGHEFTIKEFSERTEEERLKFSKWCGLLKWYMALRKVDYQPKFA